MGKHRSGELLSRASVRGVAVAAAAVLALGALATTSASVSRHASADTTPVGGLPATVSADALPTVQIDGVAWAQVTVGNTVYVTGSFSQARPAGVALGGAGSVARSNLLAYDITTGNLITSFDHSLNAQGLAIAASPDGSTVYVVGDFTSVDGVTHNHIAAFSTATGLLISTFNGNLNGSTKAVTANNSNVYVGGSFSTANGVTHQHLAAFSAAGTLLSWNPSTSASVTPTNPTATAIVTAMVLSPDGSRVVVAGKFDHLDSDARTGLGAVDAVTGADEPWAASNPIADFGATSNLTSLTADATQVYGGGYYYTHGGNFEGRFAMNPDTGAIIWMNTCHGDTYATFPMGQVLYSASHEHECSDIGAFSQTTPGPIQALHHFGAAETTYPTGSLHPAIFTVGGGPTYYNFGGEPSGTQLDWYPTFTEGTYTGQSQAAWSISGNSNYISYGGEFPTVNGTDQQGLVRFAISSIAPNKVGPAVTAAALAPTVVSQSAGTARIGWQTASDQDNSTLTYAVTRDGSTTPIYTTTVNSTFYDLPALSYVDKFLVPGSSHSYKVRVTDPYGNTVLSSATSVTISSTTVDPYTASVLASAPIAFWPLSEPSGSTLAYDYAGGADLTMGAHGTFGVAGPRAGSTAVAFQGDPTIPATFTPPSTITDPVYSASTSGSLATAPPLATYSVEAWVQTTSTTGGMIAGDGLWQTNDSQIEDRVLYFDTSGDVRFGAYNNGPSDAGLKSAIASPTPYNDGSWHYVVGTLGASGATLYVDGVQVASDPTMVDTSAYYGNWRVGGDSLAGWPSAPSNGYLAGSIADVAIYPTALSATTVLSHFNGTTAASTPVSSFTASCTNLSCVFDGSGSSDTGGTITNYAWDFGDGHSATGANPTHAYAASGTYTVKLTVTDTLNDTAATTQTVHATSGASTPVAAFTANCTGLSCVFDGSGSSDTGGTITNYAWDFGDGHSATGANPTHAYTAANTYTVQLTVTDNLSATNSTTTSVSPASALAVTTTTSVVAAPGSPTTVGTSVTLTATVSPTADGSVQFMDGSSTLGSPVTVSGGTASMATSSLSQATHSITAMFTPTNPAAFSPSTSTALSYEVDAVSGGGGGGGGGGGAVAPAATASSVVRIAGTDRFLTAVATMNTEFPTDGSAGAVVLARADNYPDALVGTALAAAKNAPLLFVQGGSLTPQTQAGIVRVLPAHGTVYLLGGTAAIPDSVATTLTGLGFDVVRYAGTDRYDTALKVAAALGSPSTVFLATGTNFPDALSAGPAAAALHGVVLLTDGSSLPTAVKAYLTAHPGTVYAVGGPAVAADPAATPLQGADRYATAVAVAVAIFTAPTTVGLASGVTFPDALSGGAYQAHASGPILLTAPATLPSSTSSYLTGAKTTITKAEIFGGDAALSTSVQTAITAALAS